MLLRNPDYYVIGDLIYIYATVSGKQLTPKEMLRKVRIENVGQLTLLQKGNSSSYVIPKNNVYDWLSNSFPKYFERYRIDCITMLEVRVSEYYTAYKSILLGV